MSEYRKDNANVKDLSPGERLGLAIGNLRLSQTGLAEECNVSPQYINNILRRGQRITQDFAQQLVDRIGINLNWLFSGEGPMFHEEYSFQDSDEKKRLNSAEQLLRESARNLYQVAELLRQQKN